MNDDKHGPDRFVSATSEPFWRERLAIGCGSRADETRMIPLELRS
jgi:hypothetical protein